MLKIVHRLFSVLVILGLALPSSSACAEVQTRGLRGQLIGLAEQHDFVVKGLDHLSDEPAMSVVGDLRGQVSALLRDYNFIFTEDGQGGIREVWIFDHKPAQLDSHQPALPYVDRSYTVRTTRQGSQHHVEAVLMGPNSHPHTSLLLIDTGATTVVLPVSMMETLGFRSEDLQDGWAQTASGRVAVKRGTLALVKVGDALAENVEVSFITDEHLGNQRILGMSFLQNFRTFSLDDKSSELNLFTR